jgi:hypothetical protein
MFAFDAQRVRANIERAGTEDLLDRLTVYSPGMEEDALVMIERELRKRGLTSDDIAAHAREREASIHRLPDGTAVRCSYCERPATAELGGWYRLWGLLPLFRRYQYFCDRHRPDPQTNHRPAGGAHK